MNIALIDNYDSFTWNLAHMVKELDSEVTVIRNDKFKMNDLEPFDKILLSPGPGIPSEAGLLMDVIREYQGRKPILGICLGEQAIGEVFGTRLTNLSKVFHGVQGAVKLDLDPRNYIFKGLPGWIPVGRYHSWVVDRENFPDCLEVTATSEENYIMGLRHKEFDIQGLQFHPESVLTPNGGAIMRNWLNK